MSKSKTIWLALLTMLLWGSLFPMVKLGMASYSVEGTPDILLFAGIRFTICGAVICLFAALKDKKSYAPVKSSIVPILLSGLFAIVLHYAFTYIGLGTTDSSKTALLKQVGALIYVCISFVFIKEDRPTVQKIVGALVGFVGIIALNFSGNGFSLSIGDIFILGASFCTVISSVISKNVVNLVAPINVTGISQLFGGVVLLIAGIVMGGDVKFALDVSILVMVYICIASITSYCIWYEILKKGELSKLFIIKFAEPVFACVFGALILGEDILKIQYLGAFILISGGICISNFVKKKD